MKAAPDGESIQLLRNGEQAFPAWLEAIASATHEVLLEMYWFASDRTGRRFADALCERARAGVDVFVVFDAVGSIATDRAMFQAIIDAGARVREYNPIAPWRRRFRFGSVVRRDHRKILVVDGVVAFTGGLNICDESAPRTDGGAGWRDDAVGVTGEAALELRALFFDTWLRLGGPAPTRGAAVARRARQQLNEAARRQAGPAGEPATLLERVRAIRPGERSGAPDHSPSAPPVQVLGHHAWGARRTIRNMYLSHIRAAERTILIANSYFVPDNIVRRALERAARRGIEVRVMLPAQSDVPAVAFASRALFAGLMRSGVHVHEWLDGMLHAKTALVDGWATVGSYNMEYRSLRYNLEVNVASSEPAFVAAVEHSVRDDLVRCREIDAVAWAKRPLLEKLLEWAYYLVRKLL